MKKKTSTTKDIPESLKGLYKKSSSLEDIQKAIKLQTVTQKQKQQNITKKLQFKQYPSIQLATRERVIQTIKDHGFDNKNILWVTSQKIHGCNFSVHCSGNKVRYGRRTDFLTKEIDINSKDPGKYFNEIFYDAQNLVNKFHNKLANIYKKLKELYPNMIKFSLYGEYFGGSFPNSDEKFKHVLKGVYYIPHHQFMVFDIKIFTDKSQFWVDVTDIPKCLENNLRHIPVYAQGTFQQMLKLDSKIDSTIPELFGFPKIENNIIEGFVVRPNTGLKFNNDEDVLIKKKNKEFEENAYIPNLAKRQQKTKAATLTTALNVLLGYLNFNRIDSVMSKYPNLKEKKKLKEILIKDIMKDATKDDFKVPQGLIGKKLNEIFQKKVSETINLYRKKR